MSKLHIDTKERHDYYYYYCCVLVHVGNAERQIRECVSVCAQCAVENIESDI